MEIGRFINSNVFSASEDEEGEDENEEENENESAILGSDEEEENEESAMLRSDDENEESEEPVIGKSEEEIEESEEAVIERLEEEIEENRKEKTVGKKRKRERSGKDSHNKHRKREIYEEKQKNYCRPIEDIEMMFGEGFDSKDYKDEENVSLNFRKILAEDPDDKIKTQIGCFEMVSRMDMTNREDEMVTKTVLNIFLLPSESRAFLRNLEGKPFSKLYDSNARKAAAVYRIKKHYTGTGLDLKCFKFIFKDIKFVPIISTLMKKDYNDNFLSVMKDGKAIMSAFDRLNKCFGSCYSNPENYNFLNRSCIELSQGTVRKFMHAMRKRLTDPIEKSLGMPENRQAYPLLDEMSPDQCKGKMDHVMGRVESILKRMFGSLFKLKKPGKKDDTKPYVFERNNRLARECERFDYGLVDDYFD